MTEFCVPPSSSDPQWDAACASLLGLWGTASRLEHGRVPTEQDIRNLEYLRDALAAHMRLQQTLRGAYGGELPLSPDDLPSWQTHYIEALTTATEQMGDTDDPGADLAERFGGIDVTCIDKETLAQLTQTAKRAAIISEQSI